MNKKAALTDEARIQEIKDFNDKLIRQMRAFLSKDPGASGVSQIPSQLQLDSSAQLPQSRKPDEFSSSKRHSLTTSVSILDCIGRGNLPPVNSMGKGIMMSPDFDSSQTRRWENLLCSRGEPAVVRGAVFDKLPPNPKDDFLADEFSGKFESDSEQQAERTIELPRDVRDHRLSFLDYPQSASTTFEGSSLFSLKSLIDRLENRNLCFRRYECDQCHRKFYNPAALGGHKSKQHPKSSKRYNDRKNTYSLRTGERRKRTFLNNL